MARIYDNPINVNNGVKVIGPAPLDDRLQLENLEDIFISEDNPEDCTLYGNIYKFAQVVVNGGVVLVLKDETPYLQGNNITVNEQNYLEYWRSVDSEIINNLYFNGEGAPDTQQMITSVGNLPAGTTIGELEQMTLSQIFKKMLFEFSVPKRIQISQFNAVLTGEYSLGSVVEVGAPYPTALNFSTSYTPEKWQWVSNVNPAIKGPIASLSVRGAVKYYYNSENSTIGGTELPVDNVVSEGINGFLYATQEQLEGDYPVDSNNSIFDSEGNYYAELRTDTLTTGTITFRGGWRAYSNASKTYSDASTAWAARNTYPGSFLGNDAKVQTPNLILYSDTHTYYFQWPNNTLDSQLFYIYCPQTYKIISVYAASNTAQNEFDIVTDFEPGTNVTITNAYNHSGPFKSYTIEKSAGITNVKVVFKKI